MKRLRIAFCTITIIVVFSFFYYNNQYYARRLIAAIDAKDINQVEQLLMSPTGNVNSPPALCPLFWSLLTELYVYTPLQEACRKGDYEIIKLLVEHGATPNRVGTYPYSPLMIVVEKMDVDRFKAVELLVENGANLNYITRGQCAISLAAETNCLESVVLIEYFESKGQDVYGQYPFGSLLHYACRGGNSEAICYLVTIRRMDVNAINEDGETPLVSLMHPLAEKRIEDVYFLLDNGANVSVANASGRNVFYYSATSGNADIASFFKNIAYGKRQSYFTDREQILQSSSVRKPMSL